MNSEDVTNTEKTGNGRCSDIYADEIKTNIKTLIRFREAWLRSSSAWSTDLFQYADPDFYFFRFIIDRQEKGTEPFMTRVLLRVMERYGVSFLLPLLHLECSSKNVKYRLHFLMQKCKVERKIYYFSLMKERSF